MKTTSTIVMPDGSEMKIFEGQYQKLTDVGTIGWRDLTIKHAPGIRDFYEAVTGWTVEETPMGSYSDYTMLDASGEAVAGVCHALESNTDLPSQWLIYVVVADLEKSMATAKAQGGEIVDGPRGLAGGKFAVVKDPAGAVLAIWQQ